MIAENPLDLSTDHRILKGWRQLAEDFLRDAMRTGTSALSREDLAFEAGYLWALRVLGVEQAKGYQHPDPQALKDAAEKLGWPDGAMELALRFLVERYEPGRDGAQADELLRWARRMQDAASATP